jgi:hypothetical protein
MAASHHRHFSAVKSAIDGAFAVREPVLRAKLTQALSDLDAKYADIRAKFFP